MSRYRVDSGDDPSALTVSYLNGDFHDFVVGRLKTCSSIPKTGYVNRHMDYVDENFLAKAGDTATGNFDFDGDCLIRVNGDLVVKDKGQGIGGENPLASRLIACGYWGNVDDAKCVTTKEYKHLQVSA